MYLWPSGNPPPKKTNGGPCKNHHLKMYMIKKWCFHVFSHDFPLPCLFWGEYVKLLGSKEPWHKFGHPSTIASITSRNKTCTLKCTSMAPWIILLPRGKIQVTVVLTYGCSKNSLETPSNILVPFISSYSRSWGLRITCASTTGKQVNSWSPKKPPRSSLRNIFEVMRRENACRVSIRCDPGY